ncbi:MAG: ABC transporter permease [Thermodesulfobacteriota bacterium]
MTTLEFMSRNWPELLGLAKEHVIFVGIAVGIAIVTGVPLGVYLTFNRRLAAKVLYLAGIMMTVPSVALFGLMIPILSVFGHGIGTVPAVIALVLYSQLPILRSTYAALTSVDPAILDAGLGMGMTRLQVLFKVQIPMALGVIFAGVRVAVVMSIGIGAIAAYIGAGGLGHYIFNGITQTFDAMINAGAVAVSVLAILADYLFGRLEKAMVSPGLRHD